MVRLEDGAVDEVYLYTADDERVAVLQTNGSSQSSARWIIRDLNNQVVPVYKQNGSTDPFVWEKDYFRRGTTIVAKETPDGSRHATVDHLGTPRSWIRLNGSVSTGHGQTPIGC